MRRRRHLSGVFVDLGVLTRAQQASAAREELAVRPSPLEPFIPRPDVAERFVIEIRAPASLVMDVACGIDLQSLPLVRAIFWLRERLMGAHPPARQPLGLLAELRGLGWGVLAEQPGRLVVGGAACQPWLADVTFRAVRADEFAIHAEPDHVKIAWTLEAEPLTPTRTRFVSETRVVASDAPSRQRFKRYWRWARYGIIAIRLLLMPAVRREAERRYDQRTTGE